MSTLKIKRENGKIFCPLADSWHIETPEEKVRQEYIKILVEDYGYSLDQMAQEIKVNNSQRGQGKARADIVIWKSKQDKIESKAAFIVVECKAENVRIREEDYYQGYNYASWAGASFFVTTNEKETKYFNVDKDYLPKELVEVVAIPTAEEALNDKKVKDILLFYTQNVERHCKSELLKSFLQSVNLFSEHSKGPDGEPVYLYAMTKESIFDTYGVRVFEDFAAMKNFYIFADAKFLNNKPEEFNYYEKQLFDYFVQAYMPKDKKVIKNIELIYNGFSAKDLSEGEKKLILIRSVLSFVADENSLILFDEPDANIHEGRKQQIYNLFAEYCKFDRQMVVATHSPILAQLANEKELLILDHEGGKSTLLTEEKIDKIKHLTGTSWDVIGQGMMLRSSRPLVVFEGKTDVMYVKRALEMLKSRVTDYASLNVDFLNANGAGNVKSFIDNLKAFVPDSKKIVVFFDRDNAGKDGVQAITGISKNDGRVAHYQDIVQDNITTSFIPYKDGVTEGDFLIEDYFSWDDTIKAIVEDVIPDRKHPIKMLPNLPDKIKKELEKRINKFEADEFNGFIPLLDKIVELTKEQAV